MEGDPFEMCCFLGPWGRRGGGLSGHNARHIVKTMTGCPRV